jgi:hypothetical protein
MPFDVLNAVNPQLNQNVLKPFQSFARLDLQEVIPEPVQ